MRDRRQHDGTRKPRPEDSQRRIRHAISRSVTQTLLIALATFCFVTSVTSGPNNLMLMTSGVNFGFRRTLPHMLGVSFGLVPMVLIVGMGLAGIFQTEPRAVRALQIVSVLYMLWLAGKIARSGPPVPGVAKARPFGFLQAAAFQWVNPKAWAMVLTATSVYAPGRTLAALMLVSAVFTAVNLPSISLWVLMGGAIRRLLVRPRWRTLFNWTMAALLLLSLIPVLRM